MQFLTSALVLSTVAVQNVVGVPSYSYPNPQNLESFIRTENKVALDGLRCNIGPDGCHAAGVYPGIVIAGRDHENPNYFYSWTRDSALVLKCLVDKFVNKFDYGLQGLIHDYIIAGAKIQGLKNPSGSLADGSGLGEPKFNTDLTPFNGDWGRPQRDGPPLRAITMITYGNWLIENGYKSTASSVIWPIVKNDLNYVAQYWNSTGFDLWEEINGSSFFTVINQYKAMVVGARFAETLGHPGSTYEAIAPELLCFLQTFWIPKGRYIDSNINVDEGRTGKDADSILGSIHTFDPNLGCDEATFQPCSGKMLANLRALVESFRFYKINKSIPRGKAIAVGRYAEDVYYTGNPWYLNTMAAAEVLYDSLYVWKKQGYFSVSQTSQAFFNDLIPGIKQGTYKRPCSEFNAMTKAIKTYADGFVAIVEKYQGKDGALSEQFSKDNGTALSAHDLTWSYAAFLTATDRRAGKLPPAWANKQNPVPSKCKTTTVKGSYTSATKTSFPATLTPKGGAPPATTTHQHCPQITSVAVTFQNTVVTEYGDTIKIVGNTKELGNWDTSKAVPLDASQYTAKTPVWQVTIKLPVGKSVEYKYIKVTSDGKVTWEKGPNRKYTVPNNCATQSFRPDKWQSK